MANYSLPSPPSPLGTHSPNAYVNSVPSGITGSYEGSLTLKLVIAFCIGLAIYNALELVVLVFLTFNRYSGVYFYSLLVSSIGIIPFALGFFLKFFNIGSKWFALVLIMGWWPTITGQSVVLWSRLHLIVRGEKGDRILKWTKWMIIIDAIVLHIPTSVLTFGSNAAVPVFVRGYNVMEKIQMSGFFVQETLLSSIYIVEAIHLLQTSLHPNARNLMYQLLAINLIIFFMDLAMLGLECANLYVLQVTVKPVIYSIKLKLEFAVLSRLVKFVAGGRRTSNSASSSHSRKNSTVRFVTEKKRSRCGDEDVSDFVDVERMARDVTHAVPFPTARRTPMGHVSASDTDLVISRDLPGVTFEDVDLDDSKDESKDGSKHGSKDESKDESKDDKETAP
jgi:hypothetical protein